MMAEGAGGDVDVAEPYYVIIITDYYYPLLVLQYYRSAGARPLTWPCQGTILGQSLSPGCGQNKYLIPNHPFWALFSIIRSVHIIH